jgi:hypothetical protein
MNPWQRNGPDYMNASQTPFEQKMHHTLKLSLRNNGRIGNSKHNGHPFMPITRVKRLQVWRQD